MRPSGKICSLYTPAEEDALTFSLFLCFSGLYQVIIKVATIRTFLRTQTQPFVPFYSSESRLEPVSRESGKQTWIQCEAPRYSGLSNKGQCLHELTSTTAAESEQEPKTAVSDWGPVTDALVMKIPDWKVPKWGVSK